jgi:citrate lyase subunit beta / citryl-CoA lyase
MEKLRRSVLYVPGSNSRALEKARGLPCDVVALDLEDSVAPEMKAAARQAVCAALKKYAPREVVVRINALTSVWGADDLAALRQARPDGIILPKVQSASDIAAARCDIALWAMIETAQAVLNLTAIAASGPQVLMIGSNDLLKEMGATAMTGRQNLWSVLSQAVIAARAYGAGAIDGTFNALDDECGFAAECAQGRAFGFDGKSLIHPGQIEIANRLFAPSADDIAEARRIVAAFAQNRERGAIALGGRMVERLHAEAAARLIARADAIAAREA